MQAYARLERVQSAGRRGSSRLKLSLDSSLAGSGEEVVIHDLSPGGILVETSASLRKGARLEVDLPELGATQAKVVWNSGDYFGCQFDKPIPKAPKKVEPKGAPGAGGGSMGSLLEAKRRARQQMEQKDKEE